MPAIPQRIADKAATIQANFNAVVRKAKDDNGLTLEGKQRIMAKAYLQAQDEMTKLKDSWQEGAQTAAVTLGRDIFGAASTSGVDAISSRDADDRASRIESPGEAVSLLARAEENGDAVLARAIAQRAYRERGSITNLGGGWSNVLDAYVETRPDVAKKLDDLNNARRDGITNGLVASMTFSVAMPTELNRVNLQLAANGAS